MRRFFDGTGYRGWYMFLGGLEPKNNLPRKIIKKNENELFTKQPHKSTIGHYLMGVIRLTNGQTNFIKTELFSESENQKKSST